MNTIKFPLTMRMTGPDVADLHAVLQLVLERGLIMPNDPGNRAELANVLQRDRAAQSYGSATAKIVAVFQQENQLASSGSVDAPTAAALNAIVQKENLSTGVTAEPLSVVSGEVHREDGLPWVAARIRAFHESRAGAIRLGEDVTDSAGRYTIRYGSLPGGTSIELQISASNEDGTIVQTSPIISSPKPIEIVNLVIPMTDGKAATRRVEGRVLLDYGQAADNVQLRLYRRAFGGAETLLSETTTREHGVYTLPYVSPTDALSLEVRAVDATGAEVSLSRTVHDASAADRSIINLIAPATLRPLASEFQRLEADVAPHVGSMRELATAQEDADRQDLTLLNRATGWDARLLALAANAATLAADTIVALQEDELYGLFRAGLPTDRLQLARVRSDLVEKALAGVNAAGIVNIDAQRLADIRTRFEAFARDTRLAVAAPGSASTYGDLLQAAAVSDATRAQFASLYLEHTGAPAELWQKALEIGIPSADVTALQAQGKLAYLTLNNASMTTRLQQTLQISDPVQLVDQDFFLADRWQEEIAALSANNPGGVAALVPPAYTGETPEERVKAYAEDMARKVRISYPTRVVTRMIERDDADTLQLGNARLPAVSVLKNATAKKFELGTTSVDRFLADNPDVLSGIGAAERAAATRALKSVQRVYQITPSNEAMFALMGAGLTSAYDVVALSPESFLAQYGYLFPSTEQAMLVYRKAQQVSAVTYNLFTIAKELDSAPPVYAISAPPDVKEIAKNELIKHFPTMESLFGSMDFCECEHCRSVLSPSAYFVDLLQFIDADEPLWNNFLADWKKKHGGEEYTAKYEKPFDALIERRPDLPHIPLTCENTQTALPYIDVVNEILEYYVANAALAPAAAHDTGRATTAELLAEPQNIIPAAYDALLGARYPMSLPFDLWLETVRRFCDFFETPLWQLLETFRASDALLAPAQSYDRNAIFIESLGISPAEYAMFSDPDPLVSWHELYGFASAAEATTISVDADSGQRIDLNSAKALSRRLGVTYKELVDIVRTGFVNPKLATLVTLYKLDVAVADVLFYELQRHLLGIDPSTLTLDDQNRRAEVEAFEQKLDAATAKYAAAGFDARAWLDDALQNNAFDEILVLADPDAGCNFDETILRYANGAACDAMAFLRINLFVRLWRKLGWSIRETDRALQVFIPKNSPFEPANLADRPLATALLYVAHLKALDGRVRVGKRSREKLLTLWAPIATTGVNPLYAELFLSRGVLASDTIFDDPLGNYLSQGAALADHVLAVQGALGVSGAEIERILGAAGEELVSADLTLDTVSRIYRHVLLARSLKLSITELLGLIELSGLDPFASLSDDVIDTIEDDAPFAQTLRFIEIAEAVKDSGLAIEDLEYLLRHRFDGAGKYRPDAEAMLASAKALSDGIRTIRTQHSVPADPGDMDDETLRQKLGLVLPADVVERFVAMMNGTAEFTATVGGVLPGTELVATDFSQVAAIREIVYNGATQEQKLTFRGVLFAAEKATLEAQFPAPLFSELLADVQMQATRFFTKHLQKQAPNEQPAAGFLDAAAFDLLFAPPPANATDTALQAHVHLQRATVVQSFLPHLQQRLIRQFMVQTKVAETGAEAELVDALVNEPALLGDPASLLEAFTGASVRGLDATFFASGDLSGAALATLVFADADTALRSSTGQPLAPAGANSARFEGYVETAAPGAYRFHIAFDNAGAQGELRFVHLPQPLVSGTAAAADAEISEYCVLKPGVLYRFALELRELGGGGARLLVQGETLPKDRLARLTLYPASAIDQADRAAVLLDKSLRLIQAFALSEREVRYLLTHAADFGGLSFSALPTRASDDSPAGARTRFEQWLQLAHYFSLKRDLAGGTDDLIDVFEAASIDDAYRRIATLTRRDEGLVREAAEVLFAAPAFKNDVPLQRLWQALQLVERIGAPIPAIAAWTTIVSAGLTPAERFAIARGVKESIKARFEQEAWQRVAQPIFDTLRQRQRNALAAHVMHQHGFATIEQLYEYFLIDPGMEPVVQTSRIRLAIGSVQLFINRCLLNLERRVHPSVINAKQWEWMKRYRVWEANRKIFLFPENWLEPEFRDDRTHLFTELETALLQDDVSRDLVEDAFLNYLRKLEALARLDIVGMHCEDNADPALNTLHVIGRTYTQPHAYFYRRFKHQMWTAWEPVTVELEGNHIAPVIWRDRLYLFWVTFIEKSAAPSLPAGSSGNLVMLSETDSKVAQSGTSSGNKVGTNGSSGSKTKKLTDMTLGDLASGVSGSAPNKVIEAHLNWSEYLQGEWSPRKAGDFGVVSATVPMSFHPDSALVHVSKLYDSDGDELGVKIHLGGAINQAFYLAGRNSAPERATRNAPPPMPYTNGGVRGNRYRGTGPLKVTFTQRIKTEDGKPPVVTTATPSILAKGGTFTILPCDNAITLGNAEIASLVSPFFYQDNAEQTFFVEPTLTEVTIEEWEEWVTRTPMPTFDLELSDDWWRGYVQPAIPKPKVVIPVDPGDPLWKFGLGVESRFEPQIQGDWLLNPSTALQYGGEIIGPAGRAEVNVFTAPSLTNAGVISGLNVGAIDVGNVAVNVDPGTAITPTGGFITADTGALASAGLAVGSAGTLNVIGTQGINSALRNRITASTRFGRI